MQPDMDLGHSRIWLSERRVVGDSGEATLTRNEADLLTYLFRNRDSPTPAGVLLKQVWGYRAEVSSRAVEHCVYRLRRKLEKDPGKPTVLVTVAGRGYRLDLPIDDWGARIAALDPDLDGATPAAAAALVEARLADILARSSGQMDERGVLLLERALCACRMVDQTVDLGALWALVEEQRSEPCRSRIAIALVLVTLARSGPRAAVQAMEGCLDDEEGLELAGPLARLALARGQVRRAASGALQAARRARMLGRWRTELGALLTLAEARAWLGAGDQARQTALDVVALASRHGALRSEVRGEAVFELGNVADRRPGSAQELLRHAESLARMGDAIGARRLRGLSSWFLVLQGQAPLSSKAIGAGSARAPQAWCALARGRWAWMCDRPSDALVSLRRAHHLAVDEGVGIVASLAGLHLGGVLLHEPLSARGCLRAVLATPTVAAVPALRFSAVEVLRGTYASGHPTRRRLSRWLTDRPMSGGGIGGLEGLRGLVMRDRDRACGV